MAAVVRRVGCGEPRGSAPPERRRGGGGLGASVPVSARRSRAAAWRTYLRRGRGLAERRSRFAVRRGSRPARAVPACGAAVPDLRRAVGLVRRLRFPGVRSAPSLRTPVRGEDERWIRAGAGSQYGRGGAWRGAAAAAPTGSSSPSRCGEEIPLCVTPPSAIAVTYAGPSGGVKQEDAGSVLPAGNEPHRPPDRSGHHRVPDRRVRAPRSGRRAGSRIPSFSSIRCRSLSMFSRSSMSAVNSS